MPLIAATSPTRTWFSRIRKKPLMMSRTSVWAPKPTARPTMPAPVSTGAMSSSNSLRIISTAMPTMSPVVTLLDHGAERAGALGALERVEARAQADVVLEPAAPAASRCGSRHSRRGAISSTFVPCSNAHSSAFAAAPRCAARGRRARTRGRSAARRRERRSSARRAAAARGRAGWTPRGARQARRQDALDQPLDDERRRGRQQQRR